MDWKRLRWIPEGGWLHLSCTLRIPIYWDMVHVDVYTGKAYDMRRPGDPIVINTVYTKTMPPVNKALVLTEDEYHFHLEVHKTKCRDKDKCHGMYAILYSDAVMPVSCVNISWDTVLGRALVIACLRYSHPTG